MSQTTPTEQPWPVISTYTRAQALADAVLVAATQATAAQAGWRLPVAYTAAAYAQAVAWDEATEAGKKHYTGQDADGREWDVLSMAARAAQRAPRRTRTDFALHLVPATGPDVDAQETTLTVHIGPGDSAEPVVTIMLPGQD